MAPAETSSRPLPQPPDDPPPSRTRTHAPAMLLACLAMLVGVAYVIGVGGDAVTPPVLLLVLVLCPLMHLVHHGWHGRQGG